MSNEPKISVQQTVQPLVVESISEATVTSITEDTSRIANTNTNEDIIENNNNNMNLKTNDINIEITEALNQYIEKTREKQKQARKRMPSKKTNQEKQKYSEGEEVICGRTINEWAQDLYKTKR